MVTIDCAGATIREINRAIKQSLERGESVTVCNPGARHNLGVGIDQPGEVIFDGDVGYYCAGMLKRADVRIRGNCGWAVGEDMMSGSILVEGNASAAAGAAIRGGTLVVRGNAGPRTAISQKGGTIVIGGGTGYMSAFMMQKGVLVIGGSAGAALADSIYEGRIFVGAAVAELGNDAIAQELDAEDVALLTHLQKTYGLGGTTPQAFTKIVSGKRLYNFDTKEIELWRMAL